MSHVEIFNAGQPRLARYPIHWHHADYVGAKGGYQDPSQALKTLFRKLRRKISLFRFFYIISKPVISFVDSISIHDSFSRFVTIHGTHEAGVYNCVGYVNFKANQIRLFKLGMKNISSATTDMVMDIFWKMDMKRKITL